MWHLQGTKPLFKAQLGSRWIIPFPRPERQMSAGHQGHLAVEPRKTAPDLIVQLSEQLGRAYFGRFWNRFFRIIEH